MDYDITVVLLIIGILSGIDLLILGLVLILIYNILEWKKISSEVPVRHDSSPDTSRHD
jgi:hypothetical protein